MSATSVAAIFMGEHRRMLELLQRLVDEADGDVRPALQNTWAELETLLLAHIDEEELYLFPDLARAYPGTEAALEADHVRIRRLVAEIGIAIELHTVSAERLHALAAELRAHSSREDELLHPWAASTESPGARALASRKLRAHAGA